MIRLPKDERFSISDSWNRAIVVAAQHRLISFEGFANSTTGAQPRRWTVCDREFENRHVVILRTLMAGTFDPQDDRELAFAALSVAMLDVRRREILDYDKVFVSADGDSREVASALKRNLERHISAHKTAFSTVVSATVKETLQSIYSVLDFSKTTDARRSFDESRGRAALSRRYSLDSSASTPKQV
jgi:hypothetical protein